MSHRCSNCSDLYLDGENCRSCEGFTWAIGVYFWTDLIRHVHITTQDDVPPSTIEHNGRTFPVLTDRLGRLFIDTCD